MLTAAEALDLSHMLSASDIFPEARKVILAQLINYYKELLSANKQKPVPTVRRMWGQ